MNKAGIPYYIGGVALTIHSANISSNICWHGNDTVILYLYSSRYSLLPGMETQQMIVDDVCECGNPVEWFRPYPGKVNAVRSVWLWLCDRCGRIWTRHFSNDGLEYFRFARQDDNSTFFL